VTPRQQFVMSFNTEEWRDRKAWGFDRRQVRMPLQHKQRNCRRAGKCSQPLHLDPEALSARQVAIDVAWPQHADTSIPSRKRGKGL
jgi:hypothetical protein